MSALSPVHLFWLLLALCLAGFALLCATVRDAGRGARRRALRRRIAALGPPAADDDEAAVDMLRETMAQARQALRQPPRPRDATVPWFLFFGDAAANLPGLLSAARADAVAPPAAGAALGVPYWRWWLGRSMVAVELHPTAVGETAGTPHARMLWLHALLALAERRERVPLHGLVVCLAAGELPQQAGGAGAKPLHAARLRRLLDEASDTLRLQLPVYLVVTGLEQLPGYATLRRALPPEVLAQAIGHRMREPLAAGESAAARLDAVFDPLAQQLRALRMALLREQPGPSGRLAVHEFIEAVRALQAPLRRVAEALFAPQGRGARPPRWRGLYFTAAASERAGAAFANDLFERFLPADQPLARPGRASPSPNPAP